MNAPDSLVAFQLAFGKHVRNSLQHPCPPEIAPRRARIYQDLLFNNVCGFLNTCFPVSKSVIDADRWTALHRNFFTQWRCHTPYFSQIPKEFVTYVASFALPDDLPVWLPELLHYEWVELDVELHKASPTPLTLEPTDKKNLSANPTLRNLVYQWPVHRISRQYLPTTEETTCLLVYRDQDFRVQFMAINPLTSRMITLAESQCYTQESLLDALLTEIQHPQPDQIKLFGQAQIDEFIQLGILMEDA